MLAADDASLDFEMRCKNVSELDRGVDWLNSFAADSYESSTESQNKMVLPEDSLF